MLSCLTHHSVGLKVRRTQPPCIRQTGGRGFPSARKHPTRALQIQNRGEQMMTYWLYKVYLNKYKDKSLPVFFLLPLTFFPIPLNKISSNSVKIYKLTCMLLEDYFIQSNLQCIEVEFFSIARKMCHKVQERRRLHRLMFFSVKSGQ